MAKLRKELKNVLLDSCAISNLLTRAETKLGELQEIIEEVNGINIMLIEHAHDALIERRENES